MKLVLFLSFVLILPFIGCQRDKMNSKNLTTVNVKRNLPASLSGNTVSEQNIKKTNTRSYHIIVASHPRENLAEKDVTQLKAKGFQSAQIIIKDQRYRVSIANYTDKQEATKQRDLLATQLGQSDIWIMLY